VLNHAGLSDAVGVLPSGWQTLQGSNDLAEFSGWQEGLRHLAPSDAGVILLNDTVVAHRRFNLTRRLAMALAVRSAPPRSMVGFTDSGDGPFLIAGLPLVDWISTYCFMLTPEALAALDRTLYDPGVVSQIVPGGLREDAFFAQLSPNLERRLRHEMFDGGWYGGERLAEANQERLRLKARCIVAELLLSARCDALGVKRIDPLHRYPLAGRIDRFQSRARRAVSRRIARVSRLPLLPQR
jgi:hypothetical protein